MRFENLFTRSARIVWRKPWLWLLALLAGESYGGGGGGSGSSYSTTPTRSATGANASVTPPDLGWVPGWINDRLGLLLTIAVVVLVVWLLLFLLSCLASGALVGSVARLDAGERVGFGESWRIGARSFWRVFGFKVVLFLLVVGAFVTLLVMPLAGAAGWGNDGLIKGLLLDIPLAFAIVAWILFLSALAVLGLRACVLDGAGPVASFRAAYALLSRRFGRVALTWLLYVAAGIGIGIVFQIVFTLLSLPFLGPIVSDLSASRWGEALSAALVAAAILVPVSVLLSSAAGAYAATLWTVAYRRFDQEGEVPEPPPLAA
jgi:hypothetical protein